MSKRPVKDAIEAIKRAREKADRILDRTARKPLQKVYEDESARLMMIMNKFFKGKTRDLVAAPFLGKVLDALRVHIAFIGGRLGDTLSRVTRETLIEGVDTTADILHTIRKAPTILVEPVTYQRIIQTRLSSIEQMRASSMRALSLDMQGSVAARITRTMMMSNDNRISDLISSIGESLDAETWKLDRAVRTETSFAFNRAQADAIEAVRHSGLEVMSRWTELVADLTGTPFDDRVGKDSIALHGQVTKPGGMFHMPSGISKHLEGLSWSHPPNRPNDRAIIAPWMKEWNIPGYIMQAGKKIRL